MMTTTIGDQQLSRLGLGTMRLPLNDDKTIDEAAVQEMVDYALAHGVNYFDTAHPYLDGYAEIVISRCLKKHPRDSYCLATKFPGHQVADSYDPEGIFEEQLRKCDVDYFDFYLLHNVYENSIKAYMDPRWGILDYFVEQRRQGRIRHLGFSSHGRIDTLEAWLDYADDNMEFAQLQVNYLDWTLQKAKDRCELLANRGIPVVVMEPIRGGALTKLEPAQIAKLQELRPDESAAAWALRWVANRNVTVILSGMSNMEQMRENVATFENDKPLSADEEQALYNIAESMKDDIPCTGCRYCTNSCPQKLDIPMLLELCNDMRVAPSFNTSMIIEALPEERRPGACIACGACTQICPQGINIPVHLAELAATFNKMPRWIDLSKQREEAARRIREEWPRLN